MNVSTLNRLATTVAISAALTAISFAAQAQLQPQFSYLWEAEANQDEQDEKDNKKAHRQQQRLSKQQQLPDSAITWRGSRRQPSAK